MNSLCNCQLYECCWNHLREVHALRIRLQLPQHVSVEGDRLMFSGQVGLTAPAKMHGVAADGSPAQGQLSGQAYTSSDGSIVSFGTDPSDPGGALMTLLAPGTITLSLLATATEADGRTHIVSGSDTITVLAPPPPPPADVDHLVADYPGSASPPPPTAMFNVAAKSAPRSQTFRTR